MNWLLHQLHAVTADAIARITDPGLRRRCQADEDARYAEACGGWAEQVVRLQQHCRGCGASLKTAPSGVSCPLCGARRVAA